MKKEEIIKQTKTINDYRLKALHSFKGSKRRSKNKLWDYSRSNEWEWFITITFDPEKVNSFDYNLCTRRLSQWLSNMHHRYCPDMHYIFVPELHKSGRYHFHGLLSNCEGLQFVDSGHVTKETERSPGNEPIYNVGKYKYGFTTATKVKDSSRVSKYIAKYITKELSALTKGKRRYWHSKNCRSPEVEYYYNKYDSENIPDGTTKEQVLRQLHDDLISKDGFVHAQEKEFIDSNGKEQFIRYYEYQEG